MRTASRAEQLATAVDELVRDPAAPAWRGDPGDRELAAARRLARLPALLGSVDPALEHRVRRAIQAGTCARPEPQPRRPLLRPARAVAGLALVLVLVGLLTPLGRTAIASFMSVFSLGRTEVRITPAEVPAAGPTAAVQVTAIQHRLGLEQVQEQVPFPVLQPAYLPQGYRLDRVMGYSYPELPAWVPQPFCVELVYADAAGHELALRLYPITLGGEGRLNISRLDLEAGPIRDVKDVDVDGQPGVLLQLGAGLGQPAWQELVWERDNLVLSLSASRLGEGELLRVASSVH